MLSSCQSLSPLTSSVKGIPLTEALSLSLYVLCYTITEKVKKKHGLGDKITSYHNASICSNIQTAQFLKPKALSIVQHFDTITRIFFSNLYLFSFCWQFMTGYTHVPLARTLFYSFIAIPPTIYQLLQILALFTTLWAYDSLDPSVFPSITLPL